MHTDKTLSDLSYTMNIEFLKEYINEMAWQIVYNLKQDKSRFDSYCTIIKGINDKNSDILDENTDCKGDAMYVASGICGDQFWSVFVDQIRKCIQIDAEEGDLSCADSNLLLKMLS
jgi:hypothetical protein